MNIRFHSYETSYFWWPKKGQVPQKVPKSVPYGFLSIPGGDILTSCAQTKFEAERLKIAPFRKDRTFLDPKVPPHSQANFGKKFGI